MIKHIVGFFFIHRINPLVKILIKEETEMLNDEVMKLLNWLEPQIDKTLEGENTPLNYLVYDVVLSGFSVSMSTSDYICYVLVNTFADFNPKEAIEILQIKQYFSDDEIKDLLLILPLQFIIWIRE